MFIKALVEDQTLYKNLGDGLGPRNIVIPVDGEIELPNEYGRALVRTNPDKYEEVVKEVENTEKFDELNDISTGVTPDIPETPVAPVTEVKEETVKASEDFTVEAHILQSGQLDEETLMGHSWQDLKDTATKMGLSYAHNISKVNLVKLIVDSTK